MTLSSVTETSTPEQTAAVARALAAGLNGGEVILLHGELGAGKTAFVKGLAEGLGADPEEVASPTFVLLTWYPARLKLWHADLYRLGAADAADLGLEELPGGGGVLAVEWAERLAELPWPRRILVHIEHRGEDRREVRVERPE